MTVSTTLLSLVSNTLVNEDDEKEKETKKKRKNGEEEKTRSGKNLRSNARLNPFITASSLFFVST